MLRGARRFFLALLLTAATIGLVATASPATAQTTEAAEIQATCYYEVAQSATPYINVRTGPGTDYNVYKRKYPGDVVSGPCGRHYYTYSTGYWWTQLYRSGGGYVYAASIYLLAR